MSHTVQKGTLYTVNIDGNNILRNDIAVTLDDTTETVTVIQAGDTTWLDAVNYAFILADGSMTAFASWEAAKAWFNAYAVYNVVTVAYDDFNNIVIDGDTYRRYGLNPTFDEVAQTVSITFEGETVTVLYPNMVDTAAGAEGFASYAAMVAWVNAFLRFNGQYLESKGEKDCFFVNGKPYFRNELHRIWDDATQSLELRYPDNLGNKPMPMTNYLSISYDDSTHAFRSYADLIDWIATNALK